jgi:hypothetical protein
MGSSSVTMDWKFWPRLDSLLITQAMNPSVNLVNSFKHRIVSLQGLYKQGKTPAYIHALSRIWIQDPNIPFVQNPRALAYAATVIDHKFYNDKKGKVVLVLN